MVCTEIAINPEHEIGKDVFAHHGLGKSGYKVVEVLKEGEQLSISEIQDRTGLAYNTVKTKLEDLPVVGVKVGRCKKYTLQLDRLDLDRIARRKGVAGRKKKLKQKHKVDREGYQDFLLSDRGKKEESA